MKEIEIVRNSHLIDPNLSIWNWEIPVYLFLGGVSAGLMIISALLALSQDENQRSAWVRIFPFLAVAILSLGMFVLFLDLEYKWHAWRFYTSFQATAPMSWGSWILFIILPAAVMAGLASLSEVQADWLVTQRLTRVLFLSRLIEWLYFRAVAQSRLWNGAVLALGIGLGIYTGILLSALGTARPVWASSVLGPLFLVSGFSTAAAVSLLLPLSKQEHLRVRSWDMAAIGLELALLALFLIGLLSADQASRASGQLFLSGSLTAVFWSLVVIAGLLIPWLLEYLESRKKLSPTLLAPVLLLSGGLALRWVLVSAGQI